MDTELARLYAEYERTLAQQHLRAADQSSVVVYDLFAQKYLFLTSSFKLLLGYRRQEALDQGPPFFYRRMHAEDLPVVLEQDRRGNLWLILAVNDLLRDGSLEEPATRCLRNLKNGKSYLFVPPEQGAGGDRPRLTPREIEVLGLVAVGLASREIADRLFISTATVNNHRQRILAKMRARNSSEAVRYASQLGIL